MGQQRLRDQYVDITIDGEPIRVEQDSTCGEIVEASGNEPRTTSLVEYFGDGYSRLLQPFDRIYLSPGQKFNLALPVTGGC